MLRLSSRAPGLAQGHFYYLIKPPARPPRCAAAENGAAADGNGGGWGAEAVRALVQAEIKKALAHRPSREHVSAFVIVGEDFSIENVSSYSRS